MQQSKKCYQSDSNFQSRELHHLVGTELLHRNKVGNRELVSFELRRQSLERWLEIDVGPFVRLHHTISLDSIVRVGTVEVRSKGIVLTIVFHRDELVVILLILLNAKEACGKVQTGKMRRGNLR